MTPTYLSIDLDYWNYAPELVVPDLETILRRAGDVPIRLVDSHDKLLAHADAYTWHCLVNIDQHADLAAYEVIRQHWQPGCGDWVDYLGEKTKEYIWCCPPDEPHDPRMFEEDRYYFTLQNKLWGHTSRIRGWQAPLRSKQISAIGVALSYFNPGERYTSEVVLNNFCSSDIFDLLILGATDEDLKFWLRERRKYLKFGEEMERYEAQQKGFQDW